MSRTYQYKKLIKVSGSANNNKFYEMQENSDGFIASFGRVGAKPQTRRFSMSRWSSVYNKRIRNGYKDVTESQSITTNMDYISTGNADVDDLFKLLSSFSNDSFSNNYSVAASSITPVQVAEAQKILNKLTLLYKDTNVTVSNVNETLEQLYITIPRNMKRVSDHLVKSLSDKNDYDVLSQIITQEQDSIDNISVVSAATNNTEKISLPSKLGIEVELVEDGNIIDSIHNRMQSNTNLFSRAFKITKADVRTRYQEFLQSVTNKETNLLWHGSRNVNIISILQKSLMIRPSNAVHTGSMFGDGLYFSDWFEKSLNYTSLRRSLYGGGSDNRAFLFLFDVHLGNQMVVKNRGYEHGRLNYESISQKGYDSVFAPRGGSYSGEQTGTMQNNEMIVYHPKQTDMMYLVEVKRT